MDKRNLPLAFAEKLTPCKMLEQINVNCKFPDYASVISMQETFRVYIQANRGTVHQKCFIEKKII